MDERDIPTMSNQDMWPMWPRLPLKHRTEFDDTGLAKLGLMCAPGKPVVYETLLWFEITDDTPRTEYASIEELADDWGVD